MTNIGNMFWRQVVKVYTKSRAILLTCKLLFSKRTILWGFVLIIVAQSLFFLLIVFRVDKLQKDFYEYKEDSAMMLNRIYSQVFLINARVNQVLEQKK